MTNPFEPEATAAPRSLSSSLAHHARPAHEGDGREIDDGELAGPPGSGAATPRSPARRGVAADSAATGRAVGPRGCRLPPGFAVRLQMPSSLEREGVPTYFGGEGWGKFVPKLED